MPSDGTGGGKKQRVFDGACSGWKARAAFFRPTTGSGARTVQTPPANFTQRLEIAKNGLHIRGRRGKVPGHVAGNAAERSPERSKFSRSVCDLYRSLDWHKVPDWVELILLDCAVSSDRDSNWAIKPLLLSHPAVLDDLLLYIDADTTVYRDVIGRCFDWIREHSLLVFMDFLAPEEFWGRVNLYSVYRQAGFSVRNLKINAGIIGRAPCLLGRTMQQLYGELLSSAVLRPFFADVMYQKNDEPYLGLAVQQAYQQLGLPQADRLHDLTVHDYALTIGANPALFRAKPGPIIRVCWHAEDIVCPGMVHWISSTQYLHYRTVLWGALHKAGLLSAWFPVLIRDELGVLRRRVVLKWRSLRQRLSR